MTAAAPPTPAPAPAQAAPIHPEAAALIIGEQRGRTGYRSLLQYAHELHQQAAQAQDLHETLHDLSALPEEDDDRKAYDARYQAARAELEVTRQQAQQHARRMIRSSSAARHHHEYLAALLLDTARQEALQRPLRAAQLRTAPRPTPSSAHAVHPALTIDPVQILHEQRQEHNAIAAAFLGRPRRTGDSHLGTTADEDTALLLDTNRDRHSHALLAARYVLTGPDTLARHHAQLACDAETQYQVVHARIRRAHRDSRRSAPWQDGTTWTAHLPDHHDPDLAQTAAFQFHLDLRWSDDGLALLVEPHDAAHLERQSGITVGRGWHSLARWILDTHARLGGEGPGPRPRHDHLIWTPTTDRDTLRLPPTLEGRYPNLIAALEALRVTLTPAT
ncbi:hypothetical protein [Deinococcus sp. 12RED42]|uniref:hypothetical protein n=1 Tax=Deinococcus sp. 12RED42 TaxID=2745872 RepID=UPI001E65348A|nr:hypothetical protein [Deinococcus sp. 12RED42]MCD0166511.1 hypothetical protein [Deinococcus sp. 12RED42]